MSDESVIATAPHGVAVLKTTTEVNITGPELADLFWASDNAQQAAFFDRLAQVEAAKPHAFGVQLHSCKDMLSPSGRSVIQLVSNYLTNEATS
jgi:hypothetical protein